MHRLRDHTGSGTAPAQTTHRLEALTDGVFAIVMTLMVFDIRVPESDVGALGSAIVALWPKFLAYSVSFIQLGIYWTGHRNQFSFIRREDHTLRWICLLFLALVALIPFSTQLIGNHVDSRLALTVYALNFIAIGLALCWHWLHAALGNRLVDHELPRAVLWGGVRRCLTAPILYAAALLISLVSPAGALILYGLVPLLYIFPSLIDRAWMARALR